MSDSKFLEYDDLITKRVALGLSYRNRKALSKFMDYTTSKEIQAVRKRFIKKLAMKRQIVHLSNAHDQFSIILHLYKQILK